jgi:hypothetical protein
MLIGPISSLQKRGDLHNAIHSSFFSSETVGDTRFLMRLSKPFIKASPHPRVGPPIRGRLALASNFSLDCQEKFNF